MLAPPVVAEHLDVSVQRLAEWRHKDIGPNYVKVGRLIRYRAEDVATWLDAQTVQTAGGAA
ncbi:helix-turn-helix domain-containing protein [Dietzia cercidiphylli]|nr:helix-turn-helix domain-containing protein [Dietzia cercidiphylli]